MLFRQNTRKTRNNGVKTSQVFHDIARLERFSDLNLFKYAFNAIQNREMVALQFYKICWCLCFVSSMVEGDESSWLRMAN